MINVGIVDDHAIIRLGLRNFLSEQADLRVVGEAANGREAIELVRRGGIDVLLLDLSMPEQNGIDALPRLHAQAPRMRIVILSAYPEEHFAVQLMRQGASGFLAKMGEPANIVTAIRTVATGKPYISPRIAELLARRLNDDYEGPAHEQLSERELQVFLKLASGKTVGDVAESLSLSIKTVSTYRSRVLEKLGLHSNSDLTYYAMKNHLIA